MVGNYHVCEYKARLARRSAPPAYAASPGGDGVGSAGSFAKPAAGLARGDTSNNIYESSDHFTGALPFMGMRVSVSKDDLKELKRDGARTPEPSHFPEAYPASEGGNAKKVQ